MKKLPFFLLCTILFANISFAQFSSVGFTSVTYIDPLDISSHTGQKPQAKTWTYAGKWWAVLATDNGTKIFRLDGTRWTDILTIASSNNSKCDTRVIGDVVHILLFRGGGGNSYVVSVQYDPTTQTYKLWSKRTSKITIVFETGAETATLDMDSNGRLWIASDGDTEIRVRWSDFPYSTWSSPFILASGITTDDICSLTKLKDGKIGVFWGNQNTKLFGFRTHVDGASPTTWSNDEKPASQSALNVGHGMADDHVNLMLGSDGTLYCAVKTGYDTQGYAKVSLLVRRPSGTWDPLYPVTTNLIGTRPIVILNEAVGKLKVLYSSLEGGGDILYKEAFISDLTAFSREFTLYTGNYNYITTTHQTYNPDIAVVATDISSTDLKAVSFLGSDAPLSSSPLIALSAPKPQGVAFNVDLREDSSDGHFLAYPNPFSTNATLSFSLSNTGKYTITLFDLKGAQISVIKHGWAEAGKKQTVQLQGSRLNSRIYLLRLATDRSTKAFKSILQR